MMAFTVACLLASLVLGLDDCQRPYLTQRSCPGDDRRTGGRRNGVIFESRSREFDRILGPKPRATALVTGSAMGLSAHEGAVFLEKGSEAAGAGVTFGLEEQGMTLVLTLGARGAAPLYH